MWRYIFIYYFLVTHFCLFLTAFFFQKYKDVEGMVKIEEVKGQQLVKKFAEEMEEMLGRKMKSVKVMRAQAEFHQLGDWNRGHHTHFNVPNLICCVSSEVGRSSRGC